ncbi:MAG: hypothetical protein GWN32_01130 [Gemmatimonadetes bacterium]|nr:hypothetical protein [Gemmatimonadota bacterium]
MGIIYVGVAAVLAAVVGTVAQFLTGYSRGGCPVSFIVAFFGVMVGPSVTTELGFAEPFTLTLRDTSFPVVTSAAAAFVLVVVVNLATKKRKF